MPVVKRYPNRKLYDTEAKQYVTLDGIAGLIRRGQDVKIVDHATGEDLTAITLTQIIYEQEKKQNGFLPQTVLTGLVRAGGETMGTLRRTLIASLDLARHVDDEIERRLQALMAGGELAAEEGLRLLDRLHLQLDQPAGPPSLVEQVVERVLDRRGVLAQADLQRVSEQLDVLAARLEEINKSEPA